MQLIQITRNIIANEEVNSVNARELWQTLEIRRDFSNWIKSQIESLGLEINLDYIVFNKKGENSNGGRPTVEYIITLDAAKHIAMASRTKKGKEVRKYFIEIEKQFKALQKESNPQEIIELQKKIIALQERLLESKEPKKSNKPRVEKALPIPDFERFIARLQIAYEVDTIKELIAKIGVPRSTYDGWRNKSQIPKHRLAKIVEALQIDEEWLLHGNKVKENKPKELIAPDNSIKEDLKAKIREELLEELADPELVVKLNGKLWARHLEACGEVDRK